MGSLVYARRCKERGDKISAMISLETIGYFSDAPDSQTISIARYSAFLSKGRQFHRLCQQRSVPARVTSSRHRALPKHGKIPSEGAALPAFVPGVSWSDQWSFWQHGYPAIMVTDTAPFRYPYATRRMTRPTSSITIGSRSWSAAWRKSSKTWINCSRQSPTFAPQMKSLFQV